MAAAAAHTAQELARAQAQRREKLELEQRDAALARRNSFAKTNSKSQVGPAAETRDGVPKLPRAQRPSIPTLERRRSSRMSNLIPAAPQPTGPDDGSAGGKIVLHLSDPRRQAWDVFVAVLLLYTMVVSPYRIGFHDDREGDGWLAWATVVDALFFVDVLVSSRTAYVARGGYVSDPALIWKAYARSWLLIDVCSALPIELVARLALDLDAGDHAFLAVAGWRLFRLFRVPRSMWLCDQLVNLYAPNFWRVFKSALLFILSSHWVACAWFWTARIEGDDPADCTASSCVWTVQFGLDEASERSKYINSLYWATTTLTSVGYGDIAPTTDSEKILAIVVQLWGGCLYAVVVGNIAVAISNVGAASARWQEVTEQSREFMQYHSLPPTLCAEIRSYLDHSWSLTRGINVDNVLSSFPAGLRERVLLHLHSDLVQQVDFLRERPEAFIRTVISKLKPTTFMPGDAVMRIGELGLEMFFLHKGQVDVVLRNGQTIATLGAGSFVGEIALLLEVPRTATVRCVSFVDAYKLTHADFDDALSLFPREREALQQVAQRRHTEVQASQSSATPKMEVEDVK